MLFINVQVSEETEQLSAEMRSTISREQLEKVRAALGDEEQTVPAELLQPPSRMQ